MALANTPREMAIALLRYVHHSCTKNFVRPDHRINTIEAGAKLFASRFGPDVMPEELRSEFGHLTA